MPSPIDPRKHVWLQNPLPPNTVTSHFRVAFPQRRQLITEKRCGPKSPPKFSSCSIGLTEIFGFGGSGSVRTEHRGSRRGGAQALGVEGRTQEGGTGGSKSKRRDGMKGLKSDGRAGEAREGWGLERDL